MTIEPIRTRTTSLRFFASEAHALLKLRDHVLTAPEVYAWRLISPRLEAHVPADADERFAFWESIRRDRPGNAGQSLCEAWRDELQRCATKSEELGWHVAERQTRCWLGPNGVLVLAFGSEITTSYIPGAGSSEAVVAARDSGASDARTVHSVAGLPRESRAASLVDARYPPSTHDRRTRFARRRLQRSYDGWSRDERIYHMVFVPAVQAIRAAHFSPGLNEWARLKERLPPMSKLQWNDWRRL